MILIVDLVTTLDQDLRQLHPELARPLFLQALRGNRMLSHTLEGSWEAYRTGRLLPKEAGFVTQALEEYLGAIPEYGRIVCLGFAHNGTPPELKTLTLTARTRQEEQGVLGTFWQVINKSLGRQHYQLITYGGARWGNAFLLRRTLLHGMTPSSALAANRAKLDVHFDISDVLSNWNWTRTRPLELAALQYGIPGPWDDPSDEAGADTAAAIRAAVGREETDLAGTLAHARLSALWGLYQRLGTTYVNSTN